MIPTAHIDPQLIRETLEQFQSEAYVENENFQNTATTLRSTVSFGYDYFSLDQSNRTFVPIPEYIQALCQACIDALGNEDALGRAQDYKNVIVSIYQPGYQLEAHTDVAEGDQYADNTTQKPASFYFGDKIIGVILEVDETGRFYILRSNDNTYPIQGNKLHELDETPGLTYLLCDRFRRSPFYHGVSQVKHSRMSITFRTVHFT